MKPKRLLRPYLWTHFQDLKPFEVLELIGIMDWDKYLDKIQCSYQESLDDESARISRTREAG